ncbi:hypothetical protein GLAREA_05660 [Glarea lozoyensis ATCC 20868]|uniref:Uncharacterized protein n=1 Tax=Glarea lozoyensis (strain ATCC 20868 / MF5171) TaxID=1116229 RepID=S3DD66_GLAL2|nr:uncharacterized protein GLAREA_05660 [Glarea lozoyensis ATCC 20868]EPE36322.1 hypothetical protein GLAREA_05660 [Glarea lozoyensis ATCC 20868]
MSNFPKLIPAFTTNIVLDPPISVGSVSHGAPLTIATFRSENSFLRSEPDYPIKVNAKFVHGVDNIRQDPSGKHLRLDVTSTLSDTTGAYILYKYSGIITLTPQIGAVLSGAPDAATTEFGNVVTHVLFETGSEALRGMEEKIYVGSGRFVVEKGKPVVVEYMISEVVA